MNYESSWTQPGEGFLKEVELNEYIWAVLTKDGKNSFQISARDTKGLRGPQDKFQMAIVDKTGKVVKDLGSHPSLSGAKKFAKKFIK